VALALVSKFAIGAWCLLCAGSWAIAVALLVSAWRACGGAGVAAAIRSDLAAVQANPGRAAALALAAFAGMALAAAAYPRYWETPRPRLASPPASSGPTTVIEYSDYECPFCAREHEETRALLAGRTDVVLLRRHFPLDPACNPAVKRKIHESSCLLARAGICAESQGRFAEMDDALFRNQRQGLPVQEIAAGLGLDLERFRACLASPETARRLMADVAAGIRDGVRATPTYVVGQTAYPGQLPVGLVQARAASAR
jgi:protein-disulfide isomerase